MTGGVPHPERYADDEMAALYDLRFGDDDHDLVMYEEFARRSELPALELGIGSGRVALHLARRGLSVTGIDTSQPMLARLRAALDDAMSPRIRIVEADMRDFDLSGERFGLVYCAAGTFQYLLTAEEQIATLRGAAQHLAPGGLYVMELRAPWAVDWDSDGSPLELRWSHRDDAGGGSITEMVARRAAPSCQTMTVTYLYDFVAADGAVRRRTIEKTMRYIWPAEVPLLLDRAGLRLDRLYGGPDLSPLSDDSDTMLVVAAPSTSR
jgi:SAM-dependent methyltransferase